MKTLGNTVVPAILFRIILLFILMVPGEFLAAQSTKGSYKGIVLDTTGNPVSDVLVRLKATDHQSFTGEEGNFRFAGLAAGSYTLLIEDLRFQSFKKKITVRAGGVSRDTLTLISRSEELDPVVISSHDKYNPPSDLTGDIAVLEGKDKNRNSSASLGDQVKGVSGVQSIETGAQVGKPVIRGLQGNRINIAYNGVPVDFHQFGVRHGPNFDAFHAEALKVKQGGAVVKYGSGAMGGVVDFLPPKIPSDTGDKFYIKGEGVTGYSTNNQEQMGGLRLKGGKGRTGFTGSLSRRVGSNIRTPEVSTASETGNPTDPKFSGELENTGFSQWSGNAGIGFSGDQTSLFLRGYHWQNEHDLLLPDGGGIGQFLSQDIVQAGGAWQADSQWTVVPKFTWSRTGRQSNAPGFTREHFPEEKVLDLNINSYQGDLVLKHTLNGGVEKLGIMYEYQEQESTGQAALVPSGNRNTAGIYYNTRRKRGPWRLEAGGRWELREQEAMPNEQLALPDAAAGETNDVLDQTYTAWGVEAGLGYVFSREFRLLLNAGKGYRFPSFFDLHSYGVHGGVAAFQKGDPALRPEESWGGDLSAVWEPENFRIKVTAYANYIDHYIYLANAGFDSSLTSLPLLESRQESAMLKGVKGSYSWKALPWLRLNGKAEVVRGNFAGRDAELPLLPPGRASQKLHAHLPTPDMFTRLYLETEGTFYAAKDAAGRYEPFWQFDKNSDFGTASTNAYALLHLRLGGTVKVNQQHLDWLVAAENLLNTPYRHFLDTYKGYALGRGRNIRFQVVVPFG